MSQNRAGIPPRQAPLLPAANALQPLRPGTIRVQMPASRPSEVRFQMNSDVDGSRFSLSEKVLARWNPDLRASAVEENAIQIYGYIGEDWWDPASSNTVKRVDAELRRIGADQDVTVYINSPGGDMFEGFAIYNRLTEHRGGVTVKILGLAASAASVIAMAGQERLIGTMAFLMIHNCWTCACGNRHDFAQMVAAMTEFDSASAEMYAQVSGQSEADVALMMDDESWLGARKAVELGFATGYLQDSEAVEQGDPGNVQHKAARVVDLALARQGMTRSQRRQIAAQFKVSAGTPRAASQNGGTPRAASTPNDMPRAVTQQVSQLLDASQQLLSFIKGD